MEKMKADKFFKQVNNSIYFSFYLLAKLPAAFFSGVILEGATTQKIRASVAYKYFTKNPFRSTYFACLSMAAEMATGIAAMAATKCFDQKISMLVVKLEAEFFKKVSSRAYFECTGFESAMQAIQTAIDTNTPQVLTLISKGTLKDGTPVADFKITWSFKVKNE